MCKRRPSPTGDMGDMIYGINVSFIDHLDIGLSVGAVLLLLFLIAALCACRKGLCLKWILGKRFMHLHQPPPPAIPSNLSHSLGTVSLDKPQILPYPCIKRKTSPKLGILVFQGDFFTGSARSRYKKMYIKSIMIKFLA